MMMTNILAFIGGLGVPEILLIALVVLLFFGGKKIPEMMRGLGKGVRSFKEGMNDIEKVVNDDPAKSTTEENAKEEGEK
jgi:twin arginine-targeting protein translocase, tatA/E family